MRSVIRNLLFGLRSILPILDRLSVASASAYSLRLLRTAYTGFCIRVRRSSDNTEQNIGFVGGVIDTVALLAFVGAGNGFIVTWYDQSVNALNATQATAANQPRIVNAGVLDLLNTKASAHFSGSNWLDFTSTSGINSFSFVGKRDGAINAVQYAIAGNFQGLSLGGTLFADIFIFNNNSPLAVFSEVISTSPLVATAVILSGTASLFLDGISRGTPTSILPFTLSRIGGRTDVTDRGHFGKTSEIILFTSALSTADRQLLEADQKSYYGTP